MGGTCGQALARRGSVMVSKNNYRVTASSCDRPDPSPCAGEAGVSMEIFIDGLKDGQKLFFCECRSASTS